MNNALCIVDVKGSGIWDFANNKEEAEETLKRANKTNKKYIESLENLCKEYPDNNGFKKHLEYTKNKEYKIMTYDEYVKLERNKHINEPYGVITL